MSASSNSKLDCLKAQFARNWPAILSIAAVVFLCVSLRLFSITNESTTTDEYTTYIATPDATLSEYLQVSRYRLPDNLPLYLNVYWGWTQIFGNELLAGRLLAVLCGAGSCIITILIGCKIFGPWIGIVAGLGYALSPFQIFHDQALRPYPLFCILAGASIYSLLLLLEKPNSKARAIANIILNTLLVYTHLLGAVLVMAQGLFIIIALRKNWKTLMLWCACTASLLLPALLYVDIPDQDPRYLQPDFFRVFTNFFAPEAIHYNVELTPSRDNFAYSFGLSSDALAAKTGMTLGIISLLATLFHLIRIFSLAYRKRRFQPSDLGILFLLFVTLAPIIIIFFLSLIIEPIPLPRYNIYTGYARFTLIAATLSLCSIAWLRYGLATAWLFLLLVQLSWLLPAGARTEFYAATRYIENTEAPPRAVYASLYPDTTYIHFPLRVNHDAIVPHILKLHMTTNHEVRPGYSLQNMVTAAHADLPPTPHAGHGTDTPHVFLAFLRLYEHGPIEPLQSLLDKSGLSYDWRHFYASEGVTVYRVWRSQERSAVPAFPQLNIYEFADNWQITVPGEHLPPSFSRALQLRLDALPTSPKDVGDYAAISFILGSSSAEGGLAIAEAGIKNFPDSGELALARGTMLFLLNRPEEARAEWRKASERISSSLHASLGSVIDLAIEGRFNESHEGFERLQQLSGGTFEPLLGEALAKFADEDK